MRVLPGRPTGRQTALPALYGRESRIGVRPDPNGDSRSTGSLQKWLCINRSFRFWKIRGVWSVFAVFAHGARFRCFSCCVASLFSSENLCPHGGNGGPGRAARECLAQNSREAWFPVAPFGHFGVSEPFAHLALFWACVEARSLVNRESATMCLPHLDTQSKHVPPSRSFEVPSKFKNMMFLFFFFAVGVRCCR